MKILRIFRSTTQPNLFLVVRFSLILERGEQLYRFGDTEKGISACAACHGPTGAGLASAVFPSLKGQWAGYSETQLRSFRDGLRMNVMMNGVAKNMSDADIEAVSSYVEGLK